jgi:poly(3-hydroxybutyrate) depolymerase
MKPVMDVMDFWKMNNKCNDYSLNTDDRLYGGYFYTDIYTYDGCLNGTQNIHLLINGAGHIWPGSIYEGLSDPVASQRIWEFFEKYDINGVIQ